MMAIHTANVADARCEHCVLLTAHIFLTYERELDLYLAVLENSVLPMG